MISNYDEQKVFTGIVLKLTKELFEPLSVRDLKVAESSLKNIKLIKEYKDNPPTITEKE